MFTALARDNKSSRDVEKFINGGLTNCCLDEISSLVAKLIVIIESSLLHQLLTSFEKHSRSYK